MKPVFIYALLDPRTKETRYVGQTMDPDTRLREHVNHAKKKRWHSEYWISGLEQRPVMEILDVVPDNEADFWEREYIQNFRERGFRLTNVSEGGKTPMRGKKHSAEAKAKISAAKFGKISSETKVRLSIASSGKKHSPEAKAKMSAAQLGKKKANNTSGFVGISWNGGKWEARYQLRDIRTHLGRFHKIEDAVFARALVAALQ